MHRCVGTHSVKSYMLIALTGRHERNVLTNADVLDGNIIAQPYPVLCPQISFVGADAVQLLMVVRQVVLHMIRFVVVVREFIAETDMFTNFF